MRRGFATLSLRIGAGLLIWAAHFISIYVYSALLCVRDAAHLRWLGIALPQLGVTLMTLIALIALGAVIKAALVGRWRQEAARAEQPFIAWLSAASAGFGTLGVLWCALPAVWLQACP